jgi:hypothetical protein
MLLQVMSLASNVRLRSLARRQPHTSDLTLSGVRLFRFGDEYLRNYAFPLGTSFE